MRIVQFIFLWMTCVIGLEAGYQHEVAVCAMFRDEAPYLKEWIEFHRLVGVEKFYLYNNLSQDDFQTVLSPYVKKGIVQLIDWPHDCPDVATFCGVQLAAFDDCLKLTKGEVRWVAFLDIDEFLFPVRKNKLADFLKDYRKYGAVGVNWQMFGTGGVAKIPEGKLLIESLLYRAETDYKDNVHIKSIVQPQKVHRGLSAHHFLFLDGNFQVNSAKTRFEGPYSPSILVDQIRINHYWSRDEAFFYGVKMGRRMTWSEGAEGILKRKNEISQVYDDSILRFAKKLRRLMGLK